MTLTIGRGGGVFGRLILGNLALSRMGVGEGEGGK